MLSTGSRSRTALTLSCVALVGSLLAACDEESEAAPPETSAASTVEKPVSGTAKITVEGYSVTVDCAGEAAGGPTVVLLAGLGDPLEKLADLRKALGTGNRVCAYDRLGEGASDQPKDPQDAESSGKVLTGVLAAVAGGGPVVLVGHSLGGLIAARYAPDHQDKVKGLVLLDATSPTAVADTSTLIPESETGPAAEVRAQLVATSKGDNPEKFVITDGEVRSAGAIPVEVVEHGKPVFAELPVYGPDLDRLWAEGQRKWLAVSTRATLTTAAESTHYVYVDQPDVAVQAVQRVVAQVK
ncbi:alpha/beta fold hydrolase [Umezawaea tangerina]|uniref:Alpha-beta hydrolase superfamily lysophospholipase n=1 Tax=Umezawaea tangerina TaxID=84725 RepID=A0A2T0SQP4_9PSEU|nr:alpha/beta hydrolase [Umezawaea tangerina]PRY35729.1 alpha-beta hydrolase superfamily lysophospholipase [Umezawaea tangerina]